MLTFTENPNKECDYWSNEIVTTHKTHKWFVYAESPDVWVLEHRHMLHVLSGMWYCGTVGTYDRQWKAVAAAQQAAEDVVKDAPGMQLDDRLNDLTYRPTTEAKLTVTGSVDLKNFDEPAPEDKVWDVMIDLETMGTRPNAAIVSIGAIKFDRDGTHGGFYRVVDLQSSIDAGLSVDGATVMWWLQQSEEARKALYDPDQPTTDLFTALTELIEWIGDFDLIGGIWGNGAAFDNVILKSAWHACGQEELWPHWLDHCYRTEKKRHPALDVDRIGVHHNAYADAATQANHLIKLWRCEETNAKRGFTSMRFDSANAEAEQ